MHYILIQSVIQDGNPRDEMNESFTLVGPFTEKADSEAFSNREEFASYSEFPRIVSITPLTPEEALAALRSDEEE